MKLGGRCPLNHVENQEEFLRTELQNFYRKQVNTDIEIMRQEFCRKVCKNNYWDSHKIPYGTFDEATKQIENYCCSNCRERCYKRKN